MKLTSRFVEKVKEPGRYFDQQYGLFLLVKSSARGGVRKVWCQRVVVNGKRTELGLGSFPIVLLSEARAAALKNRRLVHQGIDPRTGGKPTFRDAAEKVIQLHEPSWKNGGKTADQWRASLRDHAFAIIGNKLVSDISPQDILAVLTPIWHDKRDTARKVKQRLQAVMRWSVAQNYRADDPVAAVASTLPRGDRKKTHFAALPYTAVSSALQQVNASGAYPTTKLALAFIAHTAVRSGECRAATWSEIDIEGRTWTIPAERTKANREHRVPLSDQAMAILSEAKAFGDKSGDLIFPSMTGKVVSDSTLSKLLRELDVGCVVHGFRSSFRDWCGETGQPRDISEMALSHALGSVEGAYARSDLLDRRRALMAAWSETIATP